MEKRIGFPASASNVPVPVKKVVLFPFNILRQRHDISVLLFIVPVVTRYDVDGCLNLGPSEIGYHVHLVDHSTHVGVLLFSVLHRADESQPARNSCPRLPHSVDSRLGLYHVAVVLSFLRSPITLAEI